GRFDLLSSTDEPGAARSEEADRIASGLGEGAHQSLLDAIVPELLQLARVPLQPDELARHQAASSARRPTRSWRRPAAMICRMRSSERGRRSPTSARVSPPRAATSRAQVSWLAPSIRRL